MIRNSFIILDRIGYKGEINIWGQGICHWNDFLDRPRVRGIGRKRKAYYDRQILSARKELYRLNSQYFINFPDTWRLYNFFREDVVFLDIETTGLRWNDDITMVGLYDGIDTKTMIRGINLDMCSLKAELEKYRLIITFNGATFDLPFLEKRYPGILPQIPHIDLRPLCQRVGLTGGLKNIEKQFGIKRSQIVEHMYGGDAVRLWRMYRAGGDEYYLRLLVEYNEEDVINLKTIADSVIGRIEMDMRERYFN